MSAFRFSPLVEPPIVTQSMMKSPDMLVDVTEPANSTLVVTGVPKLVLAPLRLRIVVTNLQLPSIVTTRSCVLDRSLVA